MRIACICIRERQITEMYLAFAAECGEARGDKTRTVPQLLLELFQVLDLPLKTNSAVHREGLTIIILEDWTWQF